MPPKNSGKRGMEGKKKKIMREEVFVVDLHTSIEYIDSLLVHNKQQKYTFLIN